MADLDKEVDPGSQTSTLEQFCRSRGGHASQVTRKHADFKRSVEKRDWNEAKLNFDKLQSAFQEFEKAHKKYIDILSSCDPEKTAKYCEHFDNVQALVTSANYDLEHLKLQEDVTPYDSVSQKSSSTTSRSTTTSSARVKAAAKRAALQAKAAYLERQQLLQFQMQKGRLERELEMKEEQMKLKMELERLQINAEISAASAEEETYRSLWKNPVGNLTLLHLSKIPNFRLCLETQLHCSCMLGLQWNLH